MAASNVDPSVVRGLTQSRFGRRDALRFSGLSAIGMALAACGVQGKATTSASAAPDAVAKYWAGKAKTGHVDFANWPLYMDPKHPELKKFTADTGITVNYQ
jgi:spermidine/putrescine transport system substrate-binding protein